MSLILEALKKSEQQRRLGEAPTLGSPVVSTRRRHSVLPVLAVLIVIAAGAGWWMTRQPAPPPATPAPPPMTAEKAGPTKPDGAQAARPGQSAAMNQERLKADAARRKAEQAKRIEAIRRAVGDQFFINARTDLYRMTETHDSALVDKAIERGKAFANAGASGFFVPRLGDPRQAELIDERRAGEGGVADVEAGAAAEQRDGLRRPAIELQRSQQRSDAEQIAAQ